MQIVKPTCSRIILGVLTAIVLCSFWDRKLNKLSIIYIGDSITECLALKNPGLHSPAAVASAKLKSQGFYINYSNQGHGGATTVDFLPGTIYYKSVCAVADSMVQEPSNMILFSILLGANDSAIEGPNGAPVSPIAYRKNLIKIVRDLLDKYSGAKVIIHKPLWYSSNTYNSAKYLEEGASRVTAYRTEIDSVIKYFHSLGNFSVLKGDDKAFHYFKKTHRRTMLHEDGRRGIFFLHPNEIGSLDLGQYWARAIYSKCL